MTEPTITCPSCQTNIRLTESLAAPLVAATRRQFESTLAAIAPGRRLSLDRGPGGLRARLDGADEPGREWTIPGASRGETGVLGEGIRQALLRDPTYVPALQAARALLA